MQMVFGQQGGQAVANGQILATLQSLSAAVRQISSRLQALEAVVRGLSANDKAITDYVNNMVTQLSSLNGAIAAAQQTVRAVPRGVARPAQLGPRRRQPVVGYDTPPVEILTAEPVDVGTGPGPAVQDAQLDVTDVEDALFYASDEDDDDDNDD